MAVRIRLTRKGKKDSPFYRIIVTDRKNKRDGKAISTLGYMDPSTNPPTVKIDKKKVNFWISKGAIPSEAVRKLLLNTK